MRRMTTRVGALESSDVNGCSKYTEHVRLTYEKSFVSLWSWRVYRKIVGNRFNLFSFEHTYLKSLFQRLVIRKKYIWSTSSCRMNFIQCALDRTMSQHFNARFHKCFGSFFASVRLWEVQNLRKNMSKTIYIQVKIWSRRSMIFSKSTKIGLSYCKIISKCRAMLKVISKDSLESKEYLAHA